MSGWLGGGGGWWNADPSARIRDVGDDMGAYYTQDNPRAFWGQAGQKVAGGNRMFENFWNQNFDRYMQQYLQDAEKSENQNMTLDDWLTGKQAGQINTEFQLQAPQARGVDSRLYDKGRFDTSY